MMTIRLRTNYEIPEDTAEVAKAIFDNSTNEYITLRDELGPVFTDEKFQELYAGQGQEAAWPGMLAWVTILQQKEGWSDREAAEAVRTRIDVKYLLGLPLKDRGFHHSALGEFRKRVLAGGQEGQLLDLLLAVCVEKGYIQERGRQRTDSTGVLAAVRNLNRLECVGESMRRALNEIALVEPGWLQAQVPVEWYERYDKQVSASQLGTSQAKEKEWQQLIGNDGYALLQALNDSRTPPSLSHLPGVQILRRVWVQQYVFESGRIRWRTEADGLPPSSRAIQSPYDAEARFRRKRETKWVGYLVQLTETCEPDHPHLITNVETTPATTSDARMTAVIHQHLAEKELLPGEHYVDAAYVSAPLLHDSQNGYEVDLVGPAAVDTSWQAREQTGHDIHTFVIDWESQKVTCPQGHSSHRWTEHAVRDQPMVTVRFHADVCTDCPARALCTKAKTEPRILRFFARAPYLALEAARQRQETDDFKEKYKQRAGIEGTISQGVRACGLRSARYIGQAKTHLQQIAVAAAINVSRLGDWLHGVKREQTRVSRFARLAPTLS
jgi:transposase